MDNQEHVGMELFGVSHDGTKFKCSQSILTDELHKGDAEDIGGLICDVLTMVQHNLPGRRYCLISYLLRNLAECDDPSSFDLNAVDRLGYGDARRSEIKLIDAACEVIKEWEKYDEKRNQSKGSQDGNVS